MSLTPSTPTEIDLPHLRQWIGRVQHSHDTFHLRHAKLMAATLGQDPEQLQESDPLPPLWHWLYFLEGLVPAQLGRDGHPARGGFLPPVPLSNRMWAGGRLEFFAPLRLEVAAEKRSQVLSVEHKSGRSGDLVFVTVEHEIWQDGQRAVREEHDIVYKPATPRTAAATPATPPEPGQWERQCHPDSTLLFRYSALTFNGHRIHYDQDYCRQVEGYDNLVIHGPLHATLLAGLAQDIGREQNKGPMKRFAYRALQVATLGTTMTYYANTKTEGDGLDLWAQRGDGNTCMQAQAWWN